MRKHSPPLTKYEIEKLQELSKLDFSNWNETEVREQFIIPLLGLLGYKKDHDYDVSSEQSYNLNPLFLQPGSKSRRIKLDYIFSVRKIRFWLIEAKSGTKSSIEEQDIDQAYFYSLHPSINCPYFLVCNGWQTNLYLRDELGDEYEPVLSISIDSLVDKFPELYSYIGATQVLPRIKESLLDEIKKVLSAEVNLDRLDEFVTEVKKAVTDVRPIVLKNFRENAKIQKERGKQDFKNFIDEYPLSLTPFVFNYVSTVGQSEELCNIVLEKFREEVPIERNIFWYDLLLREPKAVTLDYFFNVLQFLIAIKKSDIDEINTFEKDNIDKILNEWIEMLLFQFGKRPDLRYIWAFQGLSDRLMIRILVLSPTMRNEIDKKVQQLLFVLPEEKVAWNGPSPSVELINIIDSASIGLSDKILTKYSQEDGFNSGLCDQEYQIFNKFVNEIENEYDKEFWKLQEELGSHWGVSRPYEVINHYYDIVSSGVFCILRKEHEILINLPEIVKNRIELLYNMRYDDEFFGESRIVNPCVEECCKILGIKSAPVKITEEKLIEYFNPKDDPYLF